MRHFDEWYEEYTARVEPQVNYLDAELGYKEALKWVWKTLEHISPTDYELLEKELGDETKKTRYTLAV